MAAAKALSAIPNLFQAQSANARATRSTISLMLIPIL
jgi:hypothetical protein